jgi:hypothetical protein
MLLLQRITANRFPAYPWNLANADFAELRRMLRPAVSFLSFPLGNALTIQGMSIVVGTTLGPAALAVFNTYRTLSRLPVQMLATFSRALWPEISRSFGAGDLPMLRKIYRHGTLLSLIWCAAICLALFVAGDFLLRIWTAGDIAFEPLLLALFLLAAFGNCAWQVGQVVLSASRWLLRCRPVGNCLAKWQQWGYLRQYWRSPVTGLFPTLYEADGDADSAVETKRTATAIVSAVVSGVGKARTRSPGAAAPALARHPITGARRISRRVGHCRKFTLRGAGA